MCTYNAICAQILFSTIKRRNSSIFFIKNIKVGTVLSFLFLFFVEKTYLRTHIIILKTNILNIKILMAAIGQYSERIPRMSIKIDLLGWGYP